MEHTASFASFQTLVRREAPTLAIVLGSGLGPLIEHVEILLSIPFAQIPGLSATSVPGHRGRITLARWLDRPLLLQEGRLHYYEGHSWSEVVQPVHRLAELNIRTLVLTNAAGGIHNSLMPGSLMLLRDHLDCTRTGWWRSEPLPRRSPYSSRLATLATEVGATLGEPLLEGIYAMVTGPCYETPAEIRALRFWGADAVGMSTGREVEEGHRLGMECLAFSCITNRAAGLSEGCLDHREVLEVAARTTERLIRLVGAIVEKV